MAKIDGDSVIEDLIKDSPEVRKVLAKYGMMCRGCQGAENEILRHAAQNHGAPLKALIADLKAAAKSGP